MQLLDCPGGDAASEVRNCNDCLPADIAEFEGFTELAQMLRGYMVGFFQNIMSSLIPISFFFFGFLFAENERVHKDVC